MDDKEDEGDGRATKFWKGIRVVPEWDDEGERNNLPYRSRGDDVFCVQHVFARPQPRDSEHQVDFDCVRLQEFKLYQKELFATTRLTDLRHGKEVQAEFTDSEILAEMEGLYGPLDQSSEQFKVMFAAYKSCFMEQLEECLEREEDMKEDLLDAGIPLVDPSCSYDCDTKTLVSERFTERDILIMSSFDPRECITNCQKPKAEWLVLPRPKSSRGFGESHLAECVEAATHPEFEYDDLQMNFALMDPKYVKFPRYAQCEHSRVGQQLVIRLNEAVDQFPCGTGSIPLITALTKTARHISMKTMGFHGATPLLTSIPDIMCWREYSNLKSITPEEEKSKKTDLKCKSKDETSKKNVVYFPAALDRYLVNINTILTRIRHYILILLQDSEHGFLHVAEIGGLLKRVFQIQFSPATWQFSSWRHYLESTVLQNDSDFVGLQELFIPNTSFNGLDLVDINWYLVKLTDETEEALRTLVSPFFCFTAVSKETLLQEKAARESPSAKCFTQLMKECLHFDPKYVAAHFATVKDPYPSVTDQLFPHMSLRCYIVGIDSPSKIYVVLTQNTHMCNDFKQVLNDMDLPKSPVPQHSQLVHGLPVIFMEPEGLSVTRRRAKVISCGDKSVTLRLLDVGIDVNAQPAMIKFVPKTVLSLPWPTQAIPCKLKFKTAFYTDKDSVGDWADYHFEIMNELLRNSHAYVTFRKKIYDKFYDENFWEVNMSVFDSEREEIIHENLAEAFEIESSTFDDANINDLPDTPPLFYWYP